MFPRDTDVPVIETLFARFFANPRFAAARRLYAGGIVAAALALVGLSLLPAKVDWEIAEGRVADQAASNLAPVGMPESLPLIQARTLLLAPETLARVARATGSHEELRASEVLIGPALGDSQATMIRVRDRNPGQAAKYVDELTRRLAANLNSAERTDLEQHRRRLAERVAEARGRVSSAEQSLSLLLSDFRTTLAQARSAAPPPAALSAKKEGAQTPPAPRVNPEWTALRERTEVIRRQLEELLIRYTESNPRVQVVRLQLEHLELQLRDIPQFLTSTPASGPEIAPAAQSPAENGPELPIAGRPWIRRTSGELPVVDSPDMQRYVDEFAVVNALLEKSRSELAALQQEQVRFDQFAASFNAERFLPTGSASVVRRVHSLPTDLMRMVGCFALAGGAFFALAAFRAPAPKLGSATEVSHAMGLPVIVSVVRHGSPDDRRVPEPAFPRFVILAAEFAAVALLTAFAVSYFTDAEFARLAGRDPFTAVAAIWNRSLLS